MGSNRAKTKASKVNKHELHKKKQQRTLIWVSGFLVALMVFSTFGVMLYQDNSPNGKQDVNGFKFVSSSNEYYSFWNVSVAPKGKKEFIGTTFMYLPDESVDYAFNDGVNKTLELISSSNFIYVTSDPSIIDIQYNSVFDEITNTTSLEMIEEKNFNETLAIYQYEAFAKEILIDVLEKVTIPLKGVNAPFPGINEETVSCANATKDLPVISFVSNNFTKEGISVSDNCILINAQNSANYITYSDLLRYSIMVN